MCEGGRKKEEKGFTLRRKEPTASVSLSVYTKGKGNSREALPMGNKSALCFQRLLMF